MNGLYISAAHKSSGKTTVSVGLVAALTASGTSVQTFKKGPDFIDPLWHRQASGRPSYNLDFNTQSRHEISALFQTRARADLALVEGNTGLHDGMALDGSDSNAAMARLLGLPVLLVIDCFGLLRGIAPLVLGYQAFDPDVRIGGIILNRVVSPRQESKLRAALEHYTDIPVLGALPRDASLTLDERHLGLTTPFETEATEDRLGHIRAAVQSGVDLAAVRAMAGTAEQHPAAMDAPLNTFGLSLSTAPACRTPPIRLGIASDSAFCFYYQDDLEALEAAGAELVPFSPLKDTQLPEVDGLVFGGGFPETHGALLAANESLRAAILAEGEAGLPIYAECGGLMYLTRSIRWKDEAYPMVGLIPADTVMMDRPQGRGLVRLEEQAACPWPDSPEAGTVIPAHEFHFARLESLDSTARFAFAVRRGAGITGTQDGIIVGNTVAGFTHMRDTDRHHWAGRFAAFVRGVRNRLK